MAKTSARSSLLALARLPLQDALARVVQRVLPAPVQQFARDALRRVLRDFPLVAELLELSRVVRERVPAGGTTAVVGEGGFETRPYERGYGAVNAWGVAAGSVSGSASRSASDSASDFAIDALLADLRGPSAEVAAVAVERLAVSRDPRARAALLAAVRNQDGVLHPLPRVAALRALAADAHGPARAAIVAAVSGVSAELSLAAIAALVQYAPEHAADPIRRVVEDRSGYFAPEVRAAAESALLQLGTGFVPGQN